MDGVWARKERHWSFVFLCMHLLDWNGKDFGKPFVGMVFDLAFEHS